MPLILLYCFAAQQQTSEWTHQKFRSICWKFSVEENDFTLSFQNPQEKVQKLEKENNALTT